MKSKDIINHNKKANCLTPLSQSVGDVATKLLGKHGFIEVDILQHWTTIVGDELGQYCIPQKIDFPKDKREEGTLHLLVFSGAFALEIAHKRPIILEKINTYFGYKAVSRIKIIQSENLPIQNKTTKSADIDKKMLVSEDEQTYIDTITSCVQHQELKEHLAELAKHILAAQKKEN